LKIWIKPKNAELVSNANTSVMKEVLPHELRKSLGVSIHKVKAYLQ
jgi:hypothetical protein